MSIQLAHFDLLEEIGRGGMGTVFRAFDKSLQRHVAIKLLDEDRAEDADFLADFIREAQHAAAISHPHIVQIYFAGEVDGNYYIVMELLSGMSLDETLGQTGALPEIQVLRIAIEITEALKAAYSRGMIHGDVKPPNIFLTDSSGAKLLDFGLAKLTNVEVMPQTESIWGSPYYVSPERIGRKAEDFRSDIYSLGATLFEALAARPPFTGGTNEELAEKRLHEKPPLLRTLNPAVSKRTEAIINKMLSKSPLQRHLDYDSLLGELRKAEAALLKNATDAETSQLMMRGTMQIPAHTGQIPTPAPKGFLPYIIISSIAVGIVVAGLIFMVVEKKATPEISSTPAPTSAPAVANVSSVAEPKPVVTPAPQEKKPVVTSYLTYQNPISVLLGVRAPQINLVDGVYYMTGTGDPFHDSDANPNPGVHLWISKDLLSWTDNGLLVTRDSNRWYNRYFTSPEIFPYKGKFYLTFTCGMNVADKGMHNFIGLAVADKITGPYEIVSKDAPVIAGDAGTLFADDDGKTYLFYNGKEVAVDLKSGQVIGDPANPWTSAQPSWELGVGEFSIFKRQGTYYLFYTSHARGEEIGYATAPAITGPWTKYEHNPIYGAQDKTLTDKFNTAYTQSPDVPYVRVGNGSAFFGPDGRLWFCSEGYLANDEQPHLVITPITFDEQGVPSMKLTWTSQKVPIPAPQRDVAWKDFGTPAATH